MTEPTDRHHGVAPPTGDDPRTEDVLQRADELHHLGLVTQPTISAEEVAEAAARERKGRRLVALLYVVAVLAVVTAVLGVYSVTRHRTDTNADAIAALTKTQRQLQAELATERAQRDELGAQVAATNVLLGVRVQQLEAELRKAGVAIPPLTTATVRELLAGQPGGLPGPTPGASPRPRSSTGGTGPGQASPGPQRTAQPRSSSSPAPRSTSSPRPSPRPTTTTAPPALVCVRNPLTGTYVCVPPA